MTTIANRLNEAMKAAGFKSQSALARAAGVPQPTVNRILKGIGSKGPEAHTLVKLAGACQVSFEWLHEGKGVATILPLGSYGQVIVAENGDPRFAQIPMVKLRLSAGIMGFRTEPDDSEGGTLNVPVDWIEKRHLLLDRLVAIKVRGESMEPSLFEDDIVIVNVGDTRLVDGQVYAVNYEGEAVVKRLARDAGQWWLTSDNADQRRYHRKLCQGDTCIIVGRVVRKESERI